MRRSLLCLGVLLVCLLHEFGGTVSTVTEARGEDSGSLSAFTRTGKAFGACPLQHTAVLAEISGILSSVTVSQRFGNPYKEPIEAVYTFPLPHNAAVNEMTIRVGERVIRGVVKRKEEARANYEQARAAGKLAALLDQERPNIFTQSIANILPGQEIDVEIRYLETLRYADGGYKFVFPMVVGPRYIPGAATGHQGGGWAPDTDQVPDASRITPPVAAKGTRSGHDIAIEVMLDSGVPFKNLRAVQHDVVIAHHDPQSATVRLRDKSAIPNKDFILSWDVAGGELRDGLVTHRAGTDGYFMLLLQPPLKALPDQITPKELVFVLDTSGSMSGFPIEKAKETMKLALEGLYAGDMFNLITFSGDTEVLFPEPVPVTAANLAKALAFLESRSGAGGTEMMRAIRTALEPSDSQTHVRIVCFMTDGYVGNDMEIIAEVQKHPNARVFAFGIGSSVNRFLLDGMAAAGRGAVEYVTLKDDAAAAARRFHDRIRNPLLTDISIDWGGLKVVDVMPRRIPDVFSAAPVVVCGRYLGGGTGFARLRGKAAGREVERVLELPLPDSEPRHEALSKLWARQQIEDLMQRNYAGIQRGSVQPETRKAITELGLKHSLMTQFTSFIAIEEKIVTKGGEPRRVDVPVEMPEGVSHEGVFGETGAAPVGVAGVVGGVPGGVVGGVLGGLPPPPPPPPPRPASRQTIRVGGNVQESKLLKRVDPVYPELARKARIDAAVLLQVTVNERGDVSSIRVLRGHPLLNDSAVQAVRQWKYAPTLMKGSPIPVIATVAVSFKIDGTVPPSLDVAVALLIERVRTKAPADSTESTFVRDGKAELELTLQLLTEAVLRRLAALGFDVITESRAARKVVGRMPVEKVEALLDIKAVQFIAPHRRIPR